MQKQDTTHGFAEKPCEHCGQMLRIHAYNVRRGDVRRYCNLTCRRNDAERRFWTRTDRTGQCWLWIGSTRAYRYGSVRWGKPPRLVATHRLAWELTYGPIPEGLYVCHRCDVSLCMRPDHLFLGTQGDNMRDCVRKGRKDTMPRGEAHHKAKLTADGVRAIRERHAAGESLASLAREHGVTKENLHSVVTRETWAHVL